MTRADSPAIAFTGLCVGISAAVLLSCLSQSASGAIDAAVLIQIMLPVAAAAFFTAVMFIYAGYRGRGAGVRGWRIPAEVIFFILCTSIGLLDLFLFMQPSPMDSVQVALLCVAAVQVLPPAAAATFFLAVSLVYVHGRATAAAAGAANEQNLAAVDVLNKMTLAATLFTAVAVFLASNTK
uniref:Uncharacterized protein n=1 Tax=Arundo donax TaxID=35708 RepID=A0A0A8YJK1_ARUDO